MKKIILLALLCVTMLVTVCAPAHAADKAGLTIGGVFVPWTWNQTWPQVKLPAAPSKLSMSVPVTLTLENAMPWPTPQMFIEYCWLMTGTTIAKTIAQGIPHGGGINAQDGWGVTPFIIDAMSPGSTYSKTSDAPLIAAPSAWNSGPLTYAFELTPDLSMILQVTMRAMDGSFSWTFKVPVQIGNGGGPMFYINPQKRIF